jgi:hypothetical protein
VRGTPITQGDSWWFVAGHGVPDPNADTDACILMLHLILLDGGFQDEEDIYEPLGSWDTLEIVYKQASYDGVPTCPALAVAADCPPSDSSAACPHGGVIPIEVSGVYLTSLFGSGDRKFRLNDCDITHNVSHDGTSVWVALVASSVCGEWGGEVWRVEGVEAHITLTYLCKEGTVPDTASDVAKRMRVQLQRERNNLHGKASINQEYANDNYSWANISVHSALHAACCSILNAGICHLKKKHWMPRHSFHVSFRTAVGAHVHVSKAPVPPTPLKS